MNVGIPFLGIFVSIFGILSLQCLARWAGIQIGLSYRPARLRIDYWVP
jgi:hypothetical protein